jgi:hypothetical protein
MMGLVPPKRKPSVRSSAPTRLSSTMSEMRAVMIETTRACPENAAGRYGSCNHVTAEVLLAVGSRREYE